MKSLLLSVCLVLVSMISLSEEAVEVQQASPEQLQQWFDNGYGAFKKQRYHSAINSLHKFVFQADSDTLNTDWGGLFLALSLEKQGLSHAAVVQFNELLKHQATPQIVNAALLRLEAISRSSAFDNDLLINQTVLAQDFEFIDEGLQDFVSYQQGRYNWAHGFTIWGDEQFSSLTIDGYYFQKHQLLIAQQAVFKGDIRTAISVLDILINKPSVDANNLSEAQLMLARLSYERQQFADAIEQYQSVSENHSSADPTLLEEAWASFQNEQPTRALGLLHAFSAPSLAQSFSPEYFILKTHIYKSHCHYDVAATTVESFFNQYQTAIDGIYERQFVTHRKFNELHNVLLQNNRIAAQWSLLKTLSREEKAISILWNKPLKSYLKKLYQLSINNAQWELSQSLESQFEYVANALLVQAEEMNLINYEMGVERYQTSPNSGQIATQKGEVVKLNLKGKVSFPVDGEFWNDELNDYEAELSDDCLSTETWGQY